MAEVMRPASPRDSPPYFSSSSLGYSPSPRPSILTDAAALSKSLDFGPPSNPPTSSNRSASESSSSSSVDSTPPSSVSLDKVDESEELYFPTYNDGKFQRLNNDANHPPSPSSEQPYDTTPASYSESTPTNESIVSSPGVRHVADDTAVHDEPSRQVDYLSHDWREEDIWCSWKHIVSKRKVYGERSRLENASWRTWTKSKYHLKTVSPERLNWLKDCDVTWLYGPLQEASLQRRKAQTTSSLSTSNSFINKKPILKKRSVSEIMLQKSISSSSLVKQAAAAVQAQRNSMRQDSQEQIALSRTPSDFLGPSRHVGCTDAGLFPAALPSNSSSGLQSPENGRRHIRFDDNVEQCIAVDFQAGVQGEDDTSSVPKETDESASSSEDDMVMMKTRPRKPPSTVSSRRSSIGQDGNGIAMLPSTKLKDHDDELNNDDSTQGFTRSSHHLGRLQPSSSQETLKPVDPSTNFLIDDDLDADISWVPSGAFTNLRKDSISSASHRHLALEQGAGEEQSTGGLRRTPSGMFMPFDDDEEEQGFASTGVFGRVVDTVNTARDIMHVIMNVGWRS